MFKSNNALSWTIFNSKVLNLLCATGEAYFQLRNFFNKLFTMEPHDKLLHMILLIQSITNKHVSTRVFTLIIR